MSPEASKLKFGVFLKCVLDFQLKEHEKFLGFFVNMFKRVDTDRDGILNENEFRNLMISLGFN
jgi:Ca2+-binding EF-hand superfamily protein